MSQMPPIPEHTYFTADFLRLILAEQPTSAEVISAASYAIGMALYHRGIPDDDLDRVADLIGISFHETCLRHTQRQNSDTQEL